MNEISVSELTINPFDEIAKKWMLVTAGTEGSYNTMTASWGQLGSLWGHGGGLPTSTIFIRPQRYTREFVDREDDYTLSFFPDSCRKALSYLGSHSGRDEDKVAKAGLTPVFEDGYTYFAEAELVLVCRKLYHGTLTEEGFLDKTILDTCYPNRDLHEMYIGQIVKVLKR